MGNLVAAAMVFIAMRRLIAATPLRQRIVARIGERAYLRGFSVASFVVLVWLGFAYVAARTSPANVLLFDSTIDLRWVQAGLQFVAVFLIVLGLSTPSPTIAGMGKVVRRENAAHGILRVTRHPFLWGMAMFGLGHMMVTADLASWILFGTLAFVALMGTPSIDAKRRAVWGQAWEAYEARTSNLPFLAILQGRQTLSLREIGWVRPAIAVAIYVALVLAHPLIFGGSPLPG